MFKNKIFSCLSLITFIIGLVLFIIAIIIIGFATRPTLVYMNYHNWGWVFWGISLIASLIAILKKEPGRMKFSLYIGSLIFGLIILLYIIYLAIIF
ncbi:hypothetical protein DCC39_08690 [Pueribacillus theae]|uniref:Uncharacterized protein n=1 Tax=Pueribacillus theae TaxID=2171751 RepID=A0A2U1K2X0_9BACI|nr:hypothetical protein DCC39_08690 [Pueribacillus theae]